MSIEGFSLAAIGTGPYPFSTNEPWATIVDNTILFGGSSTYADLTFQVNVIRSDGSFVWFTAVDGINGQYDSYSRYIRVLVDGTLQTTHYSQLGSNTFTDSVGTLSAGWHSITIRIDGGYLAQYWYLSYHSLGGGNYVFPISSNADESQPQTNTLTVGGTNYYYTQTHGAKFPGQFIYDQNDQNSYDTGHYKILGEVTNTPSSSYCSYSGFWGCYTDAAVDAYSTTVHFYARIIDNPSIPAGSQFLSLDTNGISAVTTQGTVVQSWSISQSFRLGFSTIGSIVSTTISSDNLPNSQISTQAAFSYILGNAWAWETHNIQFRVDIITDWRQLRWSTSNPPDPQFDSSSLASITHSYILGDGIGTDGSNSDRWVTILPGCLQNTGSC